MEFSALVDAVGRAWRAEDLYSKQHSLTGNTKLIMGVAVRIDTYGVAIEPERMSREAPPSGVVVLCLVSDVVLQLKGSVVTSM